MKVVEGRKRNFSTSKLAKSASKSFKNCRFWHKKARFWTKNTCKIETNGPRDLKLGLKIIPRVSSW